MTKGNNKVTFHFHKLHKSWRKGQPPPSICYYSFPEELELCLVETLVENKRQDTTFTEYSKTTQSSGIFYNIWLVEKNLEKK